MNVNLLKIDVSSTMPAEPARSISACRTNKTDAYDTLNQGGKQIDRATTHKRQGESLAASATQREDTQESYNNANDTQIDNKESQNDRFDNVFQRRLKTDKLHSEGADNKITEKPQEAEQEQSVSSSAVTKDVLAVPNEQKQSDDDKPASNQPNPSLSKLLTQTGNNASNLLQTPVESESSNQVLAIQPNTSATAPSQTNAGQAISMTTNQAAITQQGEGQAISGPSQTNAGQRISLTTTQAKDTKQGEGQAISGKSQNTGAEQNSDNNLQPFIGRINTSANLSQTAADKSTESANQIKPGQNLESVGMTDQSASVQSKTLSASLSTTATVASDDTKQLLNAAPAGGQQSGFEAVHRDRVKNETVKNRTSTDKTESQASPRPLTADGSAVNEPAGKLNIEKVELFSANSGTPKSDLSAVTNSGNGQSQPAQGQAQALSIGDCFAGNRTITVDRGAATVANGSLPDTAAAIREQICNSIQGSIQQGQNQITIHLNPPELGRVSIQFSEQGKGLTGLLEATNPQTRAEIRQAIPEIIRSLEESGITVKRLDVMLSDLPRQSNQESSRNNSSQDMWWQSGQSGLQNSGGNKSSYNPSYVSMYSGDATGYSGDVSSGSHQSSTSDLSEVSDGFLNVLF
jgi:flagellar hook-length control protein FliK